MNDLSPTAILAEDVPFGIEELFYSRTDKRGIILAGNSVFRRVSGYDWPALIGAPHRLVRHPGTPRAVFRILWGKILQGNPAAAYICNLAADGRPYWVFATVLPCAEGFLSVRIKPTSPLFSRVKAIYATLAAAEAAGQISPEDSATALCAALKAEGFTSYTAFMRAALLTEFEARNAIVHSQPRAKVQDVARIRASLADVVATQGGLLGDFERMQVLPTNLRILASRLEPEGGPLGAISDIYLSISADIFRQIKEFSQGETSLSSTMSERFENAVFLMLCSLLQDEVARPAAQGDMAGSGIDQAAERDYLTTLGKTYDSLAMTALDHAAQLADAVTVASKELRRSMLSLETVTVMGRVESARIGAAGYRIADTIDKLHDLNAAISVQLDQINDVSGMINAGLVQLRQRYRDDGDKRHKVLDRAMA